MHQDIENIIITNLPENKLFNGDDEVEYICECEGFNQAISQIDTSLIADEVLKVVVEKIEKELEKESKYGDTERYNAFEYILELLSNLSPNKENKNK